MFVVEKELLHGGVVRRAQVVGFIAVSNREAPLGEHLATMAGHLNGPLEDDAIVLLIPRGVEVEIIAPADNVAVVSLLLHGLYQLVVVLGVGEIFYDPLNVHVFILPELECRVK